MADPLHIHDKIDGDSLRTGDEIAIWRANSAARKAHISGTTIIGGANSVYATKALARAAFDVNTPGAIIGADGAYATAAAARTAFGSDIVERTLSVAAPGNVVIPVFVAARAYTINAVTIYTRSGTVTAAVKIGTTDVTSLATLSVTSTPQTVSATGANAMVAGNTLNISFSAGSTPLDLHATFKLTLA